jgi:hypothetical protein
VLGQERLDRWKDDVQVLGASGQFSWRFRKSFRDIDWWRHLALYRAREPHALSAGEGLGDATLLRSWRTGVFSVMRIYFSATLRCASAMSRPNFTEVYYFSHAVLLPPDGATITIIPFLKTYPFLYVLFYWSKVASHPPILAMKTFPFTSEIFYSCSLATATLATYAILSG